MTSSRATWRWRRGLRCSLDRPRFPQLPPCFKPPALGWAAAVGDVAGVESEGGSGGCGYLTRAGWGGGCRGWTV